MRRHRAEVRTIEADPIYGSITVAKFINMAMMHGKKSLARRIVYRAIEDFAEKVNSDNPVASFKQALENAKPRIEVKTRRIGGANYQVPVEILPPRSTTMAMRWILSNARNKVGRSMLEGLIAELTDCFNNQGSTIKKKDDTHRMAEANKAFAHYKW